MMDAILNFLDSPPAWFFYAIIISAMSGAMMALWDGRKRRHP